ncbi:hypothetical protein POM88_000579 [Heracleum sosnowskyi]|uniref:Uncharacterized protein n=1 Tax=Heracleum sosnowskyi TaxID=360622 RepID=A0AAD8JBF0_9APIA|nr:hypothetical protein POM88_000579 [Heracleum sosnowskyi]
MASLEVTDKRIERLVSTIKDKHLCDGFIRNPQPTNDDYDDTSLKWYVPEFSGASDSEDFLEWVSHMEYLFDYKGFDDQRSYKIANMNLTKYASLWFANLKIKLMREGAPRITTWTEMKRQLNNHFGLKDCIEDKVVKKDKVEPDIVNVEDKLVESRLDDLVKRIPFDQLLFVGGDFNGHFGSRVDGYQGIHGGIGFGVRNAPRTIFLEFSKAHELVIVNCCFQKLPKLIIFLCVIGILDFEGVLGFSQRGVCFKAPSLSYVFIYGKSIDGGDEGCCTKNTLVVFERVESGEI